MPTLNINGTKVKVGDEFLGLSADQQNDTVDEIASSLGGGEKSVGGFIGNLASDTGEVLGGLATAATQPIETAKTLGKLGVGMVQEMIPGQQQYEAQYADPFYKQIGKDFGFKRGEQGIEWSPGQLGQNLYERPVSVGLSGAALAAPLESIPGKVGAAARIVNPLNAIGKGISTVAKIPGKIGKYAYGEYTGLGPQAISEAYRSGKVGGMEGDAFRAGMRGTGDPTQPVDIARGVVGDLRKERSSGYVQGMADVNAQAAAAPGQGAGFTAPGMQTAAKLDFAPIDTAFGNSTIGKPYRGKTVDPEVTKIRDQVSGILDEWRNDPGAWNVEGFDALKQRLQDIGTRLKPNTPEAKLVGQIAGAVKQQIIKQAPEYAKVMKAYEMASNQLDEVIRTFSLGKKTSYDTALRKLQSILRNNAYTNWSARAKLAEIIQKRAPELMPMLSGQAASAFTPRGLPGKLLAGGGQLAGLTAVIMGNPLALIPMLAGAISASPRVAGEAIHGAGRIRGAVQRAPALAKSATKATIAIAPRADSLRHAENVLSQNVLDHIKRAPSTRGPLNDWLKARASGSGTEEATQMLASAIMKELKIDDPTVYDRIINELNQTRGP